MQVIRYTQD